MPAKTKVVVLGPKDYAEAQTYASRIIELHEAAEVIRFHYAEQRRILEAEEAVELQPILDEQAEKAEGLWGWSRQGSNWPTDGRQVIDLVVAEIGFSPRRLKAKIKGKTEDMISLLERLQLPQFIRVKKTLNRQAMIDDPETANSVPGISVDYGPPKLYLKYDEDERIELKRRSRRRK